MKNMKKIKIAILFSAILVLLPINKDVNASEELNTTNKFEMKQDFQEIDSSDLKEYSFNDGVKKGSKDFIVSEMDNENLNKVIKENENNLKVIPSNNISFYSKKSKKWKYMYTVEPYSFYKNDKGQIRVVQTTPTTEHVANTVVNGVVTNSTSWPIPVYNGKYDY